MKENLVLYSAAVPSLESGLWKVRTVQKLRTDTGQIGGTIEKEKEFQIGTNLFSIGADQVVNRCPQPEAAGSFTNTIAHVILKEPELPWTAMDGKRNDIPAVALLMVKKEELALGGASKIQETVISRLLHGSQDVLKPDIKLIREESAEEACRFMRLRTTDFDRIAPRLEELLLLAHCRQVYIGDKAELNLNRDGLFSVVMSNRLPEYEEGNSNEYHICLVSTEGLWKWLDGNAETSGKSYIDLIVLDHWKFTVTGTEPLSFRKFCERAYSSNHAAKMLSLETGCDETETGRRLRQGYVPMLYHTRTGDEGMAWYRSPLTPVAVPRQLRKTPFFTADAAMIYDAQEGIFDLSYAAAWEAGRMAALQDEMFCLKMQNLRRKGKALTDLLVHRIYLEAIEECQAKGGETEALCRQKISNLDLAAVREYLWEQEKEELLLESLGGKILDDAGSACPFEQLGKIEKESLGEETKGDMAELIFCLMEKKPELLSELLREDVQLAASWLAKLYLLYPVSYDHLIPHKDLLPMESLRFFYLDENWLDSCMDGAMSLGMDCSRQAHFNKMIRGLMAYATEEKMLSYRASLYGGKYSNSREKFMSGMIIKSSLVSGWPTLELKAVNENGRDLVLLRMERLSQYVILAFFDGKASEIRAIEPKESIQMKVEPEFDEFRNTSGKVMELSGKIKQKSPDFVRPFLTVGDRVIFREGEADGK